MIITKTPLRISLGGGGTDLPSYYRSGDGGFLVAAAITRHIYVAVNHNFDDDLLLKYSRVERVPEASGVEHPLLRECLLHTGVTKGIEVSSMADIPAGTGLGSSGTFAVGTLKALHEFRREIRSNVEIAAEACEIEIDRLGEPVGKQDQYIAAVGGVTAFEFRPDDTVEIRRLSLSQSVHDRLEENLLLFYTGVRRSASEVLWDQDARTKADAGDIRANLDSVRALGHETVRVLEAGDLISFGALLTEQWDAKLERSPSPVHSEIDEMIREGIDAGAAGGKLVGAGGGGFLLFYAEDKAALRDCMAERGLPEVRFGFDHLGTTSVTQ